MSGKDTDAPHALRGRKGELMANTPFELYEEAYRLHYSEKKIPDAVKMYEAIMREFPDSSECGYAFIQLQKIKANAVTAKLASGGVRGNSLMLIAYFAGCAALIVAVGGILVAFHELRAEHNRTTFAVTALAEVQAGRDQEARKILDEMKKRYTNDILARELLLCIAARESDTGRKSAEGMVESDSSAKLSPAVDRKPFPAKLP
jgi:hypothetical protein